jgi:hypothetical protein
MHACMYTNVLHQTMLKKCAAEIPTFGELSIFCSISAVHGVSLSSSLRGMDRKIPKNSCGRLIGQFQCPVGWCHPYLRLGELLEKGPTTKILCPYAKVGSTMYSTGASSSVSRCIQPSYNNMRGIKWEEKQVDE